MQMKLFFKLCWLYWMTIMRSQTHTLYKGPYTVDACESEAVSQSRREIVGIYALFQYFTPFQFH